MTIWNTRQGRNERERERERELREDIIHNFIFYNMHIYNYKQAYEDEDFEIIITCEDSEKIGHDWNKMSTVVAILLIKIQSLPLLCPVRRTGTLYISK